ncbi:MAG: T9SS type A sorting domain-containing protein [Crocinitomicaceae bacterium]|nr:T9SS type A sorting domain-containing protein [Crocinitomicaceae bacterium]
MKNNCLSHLSICIRNCSLVIALVIFSSELSFGQDVDGDGVTDVQELTDGTDPTDPCNRLTASITLPVSPDANGNGIVDTCDPVPVTCAPLFYQVISGQLNHFDTATNTYVPIGTSSFVYNAMGYNEDDDLFYAMVTSAAGGTDFLGDSIAFQDIIKIDYLGNRYFAFTPIGLSLTTNYNAGDISDGFLYLRGNGGVHVVDRIDLSTGVATPVGTGFAAADGAIISNVMYGCQNTMFSAMDLTSGVVTISTATLCSGGAPPSGGYGAAFVANNDELYLSSNSGGLYRVYDYTTAAPCFTLVATTATTSGNDGASCPSSPPIALPVELLTFYADCKENQVRLDWATVTELNNDYFTIERSRDAINFESIAKITGKGSTTTMSHYTWIDESPISGTTYYRLSQTDFDGTKETFKTHSVNCIEDNTVSLYPNPIENVFLLNSKYGGSISMIDQTGKIILDHPIIAGKNTIQSDQIASGSYFAFITLQNGTREVIKVIKF